ncbi:MAG TPA: NUDIX domain-containing protein [Candidatus Saccharimonadales bacterium]
MPHINEKYDFVISVFIVHDNKVLLVNHPRYNKWIPMGGHIELDEDPDEALFREIEEETGLDVEILSPRLSMQEVGVKFCYTPMHLEVHEANATHKHIALIYYGKSKTDKYVLSDEHTGIGWVDLEELESPKYNLSESDKFYCREAIKESNLYIS